MEERKLVTVDVSVASGIWKFDLSINTVIKIACLLRDEDVDKRFTSMTVRGCGKHPITGAEQSGIEFRYHHESTSKRGYQKWFRKMKQRLESLSEYKLCGWDIHSSTITII